jgi:DNA polymerase family A
MATRGYMGQVFQVRPILAAMENRGMPIDDSARLALDGEFATAQSELGRELAALAPDAAKRVHPKEGYKGVPPEVKAWMAANGVVVAGHPTQQHFMQEQFNDELDESGEWYHYEQRPFEVPSVDAASGEPVATATTCWCRVYDFNPNSSQQLLAYMKSKKHKIPKGKVEDADGNAKDTTAKKELQRLAHRTGDTFYLKVIEYRELSKMRGTYIEGFKPHSDGRVHTTFTFDTGTGQLTSRNPNIQNFPKHGRLAHAIRGMVRAPDGHVIVEADFKSYHVLTTGFEAESAPYMRMARLDMHSFITGCFLNLWSPRIMEESDDVLLDKFRWLKSDRDRKRIRDKQAKPAILGIGFGMGARRLYQENLEHFDGEKTAKRLLDMLKAVFPEVFKWQDRIRQLAHQQQYLRSRFGHLRRFYEVFTWRNGSWSPGDQAEEAVAFLPANHAFGNIRECMKEQRTRGLDERFGLCNNVHDSFVYVFPETMLDEFLATVVPVLTAPSKVLTHPTLAPAGLTVDVEVCAGRTWADMAEIPLVSVARQ